MQLETQYQTRSATEEQEVEDLNELHTALIHKDEDLMRLTEKISELTSHNTELKSALDHIKKSAGSSVTSLQKKEDEIDEMRKTMTQQLTEFASMKKKLVRRC